jgi:hypothetical protein
VVTVFQLNLVEFPGKLHLGFVLKYMFGVSVAVIVPLLGLMIYSARIGVYKMFVRVGMKFSEWKCWLRPRGWKRYAWIFPFY